MIKISEKDNSNDIDNYNNIINFDNEKEEIIKNNNLNFNLIKTDDENLKENIKDNDKDNNKDKDKDKDKDKSKDKDKDKVHNPLNGEIEIKNLKRPFTIFLHYIKMKKDFDCINEKLNEFHYKVKIKVQIFCGGKEYTKHKTIEWRSKFVPKNKHIGKLIEFDLGYESLPMFASIVFKIKIVLFNNKKQPIHMDNFYWTNFKLFDHNRRLKTGN
jgi:hypothetical protein